MRVGETLEMTCSVPGGKPLVTSVNFSCPHHPDRTPDIIEASFVTSDLEIKLKSSDDGALCVCSALWKSSAWYPKISTRVLVVMGTVGESFFIFYIFYFHLFIYLFTGNVEVLLNSGIGDWFQTTV